MADVWQKISGTGDAAEADGRPVDGSCLERYWDMRSRDYEADSGTDDRLCRDVVAFLGREGVFVPGDDVLDVGCGPGTYALHFAAKAGSVTGLDASEAMLAKMGRAAADRGIENVRPVHSRWEEYGGPAKYDLVFSSFCPAIDDAASLLRMEARSRRSCCYVASADADRETPADRLREILTGEKAENDPADALYIFNVLHQAGRSPSLRTFPYACRTDVPADRLVEQFIAQFAMQVDMDRATMEIIRDYVESISTGGVYRREDAGSVFAIYWCASP